MSKVCFSENLINLKYLSGLVSISIDFHLRLDWFKLSIPYKHLFILNKIKLSVKCGEIRNVINEQK